MFQDSDHLLTEGGTEGNSMESTQQSTPASSTDTSNVFLNTATDPTPEASKPNATKHEGAGAASAASEPDTATLTDAEGRAGETSAEKSSGQAAASLAADQPKSDIDDATAGDDSQEADLTFDEALAETALGAELSDRSSSNTSSSNQTSSDDLTFDQALAAGNKTQHITDAIANSTHSIMSEIKHADPRAMSPVLESLLPSTESLNGSLRAAVQESEGASNATAANSSDEGTLNATHWTGLAGATVDKAGEALAKTANASTSLLDKDVLVNPSNSSLVNATRDTVTGAASAAAGAVATASSTLSNATAALAAATNTTAVDVTNTTVAAGGSESDSLLGSEVLNASVADGVLHSGADKVAGALSGVKSWLSSSKANDAKQGELQTSDTEYRAAAAELGTEEIAFTAQTNSNSGSSARKQPLPSDLSVDGADLEDFYMDALPASASASSTAADKTSSTIDALPTAGARQAAAQATEDSASARLTGTNSSTDAVVAAALANPKGSASKAATAASQRAAEEEQEDAEWRVRQQATAGSSSKGGAVSSGTRPQAGTSADQGTTASAVGLDTQSSRDKALQESAVLQARQAALGKTSSLDTYEDTHEDEDALPLGQHPHSSIPRAGSSALPRAKPISSQASDTLTPAQQRELERESAYQASTGSVAGAFTDSSAAASGKSTASHLSWGAIAGQGNTGASQGDPTVRVGSQPGSVGSQSAAELDQRTAVKHQSLGDSESEADMEDYDPRAFATGSSTDSARGAGANYADPIGQAQGWNPRTNGASTGSRVQPSMGGDEGYGQEDSSDSRRFMVNRDPADPRSVVGAHLSRDGQAQAGRQQSAASNAAGAGGLAAGKTKMSLMDEEEEAALSASAQASRQSASKQSVPASDDGLAGPVVRGSGAGGDKLGSKQSANASETLHGLLDNIIDNWVVITALSALACTGAVLGFMFLRGFVPSPYDAINISNSGHGGYAGNNGYHGVSREDEENGWEGWAEEDAESNSQVKRSGNGNSPPRGTGVGKLKKGTFAKKKPANWSNDF
ncbi:hypothetical protein ABBQ38_007369 [Trebouxia sp. C0009 RCD-2024]